MHNFSAESKKTESRRENVSLLYSERITINFTFPDLFLVKNQYLNLKIAKEQNFKEF